MEVVSDQNGALGLSNAQANLGLEDIVSSPQARILNIPDANDVQAGGKGAEELEEPAEQFSGWLHSAVGFILGPNRTNPVWRLRLCALFCLALTLVASAIWLPGNLHESHTIYQRVIFIANFGVPITVAMGSLVLSVWMAHNPNEWANCATWLLVANAGTTGGGLILYIVRLHGK